MPPPDPHIDDLLAFRVARRRRRWRIAMITVLVVGLVGLLPVPLGTGLFGWRLFRYDRVEMHFINITGGPVTLEVGTTSDTFAAGRVHSLMFRAGDVELVAFDEQGRELDRRTFFSDNQSVFYNLSADCFAMMDATGLYNDGRRDEPFELIGRIRAIDRITLIPDGHFIPPRGVAPDQIRGQRVIWIDDVACQLLEPHAEEVLLAQQTVRMQARRDERRRRLQAQE